MGGGGGRPSNQRKNSRMGNPLPDLAALPVLKPHRAATLKGVVYPWSSLWAAQVCTYAANEGEVGSLGWAIRPTGAKLTTYVHPIPTAHPPEGHHVMCHLPSLGWGDTGPAPRAVVCGWVGSGGHEALLHIPCPAAAHTSVGGPNLMCPWQTHADSDGCSA